MKKRGRKNPNAPKQIDSNVSTLVNKVSNMIDNLKEGQFLHLDGEFNSDEDGDEDSIHKFLQESINLNPIKLDNFQITKKNSENSFEIEYSIIDKKTEKNYLAKTLSNDIYDFSEEELSDFSFKINTLSKINSHFMLKFIGYSLKDFNNDPYPTIIFENSSKGSLDQIIESEKKFSISPNWNETKKFIVIYGIASGMSQLHSQYILNCKLKPENIYLDDNFYPKIFNFTFTKRMENSNETFSDVYSFSMIIYELIGLEKPPENLILSKPDKNVPLCYWNLIRKCSPTNKTTFNEILYLLKASENFNINEDEFMEYLKVIGESESTIFKKSNRVHLNDKPPKTTEIKNLSINLKPTKVTQFEKLDRIGDGTFSKVYKVHEKRKNLFYSAKIFHNNLSSCSEAQIQNITSEVNLLSKLNSPLIIQFIGFSSNNFKNKPKPTIFAEFAPNGSLEDVLELERNELSHSELDDTKKLCIIYGIALGMSHLHSLEILHRNLKPSNILLDEFLFPKIGDFGLSIDLKSGKPLNNCGTVGTPAYMAPEILTNEKYSKEADVYAFALIVFELLSLEIPYNGLSEIQLTKTVIDGQRPEIKSTVPDCYKRLIESCWSQNPQKRPTFDEIVNEIKNNEEFITKSVNKSEFNNYIRYVDGKSESSSCSKISVDLRAIEKVDNIEENEKEGFIDLSLFSKQNSIFKEKSFKHYLVKNNEAETQYIAKCLAFKIKKLNQDEIEQLKGEVQIISQLNHPSFVKMVGFSLLDFKQKRRPVTISENPSNGSLSLLLENERKGKHVSEWNETKKLIVIYGIAAGMSYLHSFDILHRNLSPASIFLDNYLFPRIGDICFSKLKSEMNNRIIFQSTDGNIANPFFLPPELLNSNEYSKASEVYSFALIVYEIMTSEVPFKNIKYLCQLFDELIKNSNRPVFNTHIPKSYQKLIEICWNQDPEKRPTFDDITHILKTDKSFITGKVNKDFFYKYVKFIEKSKVAFYSKNKRTKLDDFNVNTNVEIGNAFTKTFNERNDIINTSTEKPDDDNDDTKKAKSKCCQIC